MNKYASTYFNSFVKQIEGNFDVSSKNKELNKVGIDYTSAITLALLLGGGTLLSKTPQNKDTVSKPISLPAAAATGLLFPSGSVIHGALVDRRNRTGPMNDVNSPGALSHLGIGSGLGMLGGMSLGVGAGALSNKLFGTDIKYIAPSMLAGAVLGGPTGSILGAMRYNKKLKNTPQKEDKNKEEK